MSRQDAPLLVVAAFLFSTGRAAEPPLPERIDTIVESAAVGPLASPCSDADFVRRVTLDLTGVIPKPEQVRSFLSDSRSDKRERLVDEVLASVQFNRFAALQIDTMLMDRRRDKAWLARLFEDLAASRPLDLVCREVLSADGVDEKQRPAARFFLEREAEPNRMTRDIGRIMFGMDLQCAQCHDHPLIDDYRQADYYGLFACLQRTTLFKDDKKGLSFLSEKADGEADYKSVFTQEEGKAVRPRLPKGAVLASEPVFAKGQEYVVAPAKDAAGIPKYSRRAALADRLAGSIEFRRNLGNRLWAWMFGRGLVHPVDFHHEDNPPEHPELLTLLAKELQAAGFQVRPILRAIAVSRTYQRNVEPPRPEQVDPAGLTGLLAQLDAERTERIRAVEPLVNSLVQAGERRAEAAKKLEAAVTALAPLEAAVAAARATADAAERRKKSAEEAVSATRASATAVAEAAAKNAAAVAVLPDDRVLAAAAAIVAERSKASAAAAESAVKVAASTSADQAAAVRTLAAAEQALAAAKQGLEQPSVEVVAGLEAAELDARASLLDARFAVAAVERRIATAKALQSFTTHDEGDVRATAWNAIVDRWTVAGQVGALRPLGPEQFSAAALEATGMMAAQVAAAADAVDKQPPERLKKAGDGERDTVRAGCIELQLLQQIEPTLAEFSRLYAVQEGGDFQASVNQSLFFGNAPAVKAWLQPSGTNLAARLAKQADPAAVAEELYVSVLSRPATEAERQDVAGFLAGRDADRQQAFGEMIWGLLSSNEFRFNH